MADEAEREVPKGVALFPQIPAELGVDPLLLGLVQAVVFLSGSEHDIVDNDAAEEVLHYIGSYLQQLSGPRLERVREDLLTLAGFAKEEKWPSQEVRFLKEFLKEFGVGS